MVSPGNAPNPTAATNFTAEARTVPVTGIVLAGGRSRRLGRDKAVEPFGGQPLIRRVIDRIAPLTDEIVVVVANAARGEALPLAPEHRVALDLYPEGGSLGGIFSGLTAAANPWGLVVACDMPFLNPNLLAYMLDLRQGDGQAAASVSAPAHGPGNDVGPGNDAGRGYEAGRGYDAIVPMPGAFPEPTHALYSQACLPHIEAKLRANDLKISGFFADVSVRYVTQAEIGQFDPEEHSFFNVNSPEDLALAMEIAAGDP